MWMLRGGASYPVSTEFLVRDPERMHKSQRDTLVLIFSVSDKRRMVIAFKVIPLSG